MRILVLGGTVFLGRHTVELALERGHDVTMFNRGQSNPGLFPGAEEVHGDRERDLGRLAGKSWDAVIDTSGYVPRVVGASARALVESVPHYTFISSISAYASMPTPGLTEDAPLGKLSEPGSEDIGKDYGPLKVLCEREVQAAYRAGALIIRPGLIVGPHDPTDRFTYWPVRVAEGGEVLAPGDPARQVQVIDARDLAGWNLDLVERGVTGVFNATGPDAPLTMGAMLDGCRAATESDATFSWAAEDFLLERKVTPWSELPIWLPQSNEGTRGMLAVDVSRALAAGLTFRPIEDTARDTLAWHTTRGESHEWRAGMRRDRERELLSEWRGR
ncbi:MAG: NAD-dependent epimerase/dehydratase family protein [Dehalococcoidia bacterium]